MVKTISELQEEKIALLENLIVGHQLTEASLREKIKLLEEMVVLLQGGIKLFQQHLDRGHL